MASGVVEEEWKQSGKDGMVQQRGMKCGVVGLIARRVTQSAGQLVLVKDYIAAQLWQFIAQATGLTVPRTPNGILGYAGFRSVLHPGHTVAIRIVELHPRPSREYDCQVAW